MRHMIRLIFKNGNTKDISLLANVSKSEFAMMLNQQIIQNPGGTFNFDTDNEQVTYLIDDISHINIL